MAPQSDVMPGAPNIVEHVLYLTSEQAEHLPSKRGWLVKDDDDSSQKLDRLKRFVIQKLLSEFDSLGPFP